LERFNNFLHPKGGQEMDIVKFALLCGMAGVAYSLTTIYWVLKQDTGTPRMQEINAAVLEGGNAFLN
jgi:Na+/H+-translocating membrane pyrophosphatase